MDFARKQLEKYGWTDGKGLGKNENGISEAIKPKLKRSVAGIGHDQAAEHTDQWWNKLYNKAAKNVEVEEKNGKTKKIKTKDDTFKITNSSYHLNKSDADQNAGDYSDLFVRTAVLTNGGCQEEKVRDSESEKDKEEVGKKDVFKMTDEELFAACEGRTAHKGARHGLKALGKLARIERQEQMLLSKPEYNGYSHSKKHKKDKQNQLQMDLDVVEDTNLNNEDNIQIKKKKKKRKHCFSDEKTVVDSEMSTLEPVLEENDDIGMDENEIASCKTLKTYSNDHQSEESMPKKKRNQKRNSDEVMDEVELSTEKLRKKKKNKHEREQ